MKQVDNGQTLQDVPQGGQPQVEDMTPTTPTEGQESGSEPLVEDKQGKDIEQELETLRKRVAELEQYAPQAKTEQELQLEQKAAELWAKEVSLTLKEHSLEPFAEFINATDSEELNKQIETLKAILGQYKLDSSFVPSQHRASDKYDHALKMGDTKGAIATKLSQILFK